MTIVLGPLTALAIGDAYGAGFEFLPKMAITSASNDASRYFQHTMEPRSPAGCYSDDTQQALALAEELASSSQSNQYVSFREGVIDEALVNVMLRDPRGGSPRMLAFMRESHANGTLLGSLIEHDRRATSGAAMRSTVMGVRQSLYSASVPAYHQGTVTHNNKGAMAAAVAAMMAGHLLGGNSRDSLRNAIISAFHIWQVLR